MGLEREKEAYPETGYDAPLDRILGSECPRSEALLVETEM